MKNGGNEGSNRMNLKNEILEILENDAKVTNEEIAGMLHIEVAQVAQIIEELEEDKTIVKYVAVINKENLDEEVSAEALIEVKVTPERDLGYNEIARRIYKFQEVKAVYLMSGRYDLSVRVRSTSMKKISQFVWEKLAVLKGVRGTSTTFIMRKYKENGVILVQDEDDKRLMVTP